MSEEKKICTHCKRDISKRKNVFNFTNITQGDPKLFCTRKCKKAWLSERINKTQADYKEWDRDEPIKPREDEPNKTFIETIEENRKILKAEYQRGYADGGANMNEKWVITMKEVLERKR